MCVIPAFAQDDDEGDGGEGNPDAPIYDCNHANYACLTVFATSDLLTRQEDGEDTSEAIAAINKFGAAIQKVSGFNKRSPAVILKVLNKDEVSVYEDFDNSKNVNFDGNFDPEALSEEVVDKLVENDPQNLYDIYDAAKNAKKGILKKKDLQIVQKFLKLKLPGMIEDIDYATNDEKKALEMLRNAGLKNITKLLK